MKNEKWSFQQQQNHCVKGVTLYEIKARLWEIYELITASGLPLVLIYSKIILLILLS